MCDVCRVSLCVCVCVRACVCVCVCVCVCARASRPTGARTRSAGSSATDVGHVGGCGVKCVCVQMMSKVCRQNITVSTPLAHQHNPVGGQQQQSPGSGGIRHTGTNERAARAWGLTGPPRAPTARRSTQTTKWKLGKVNFFARTIATKSTGWFDWGFTKGSLIKKFYFPLLYALVPLIGG